MENVMNAAYPVSIEGELDPNLSRWFWPVKLFLAIPHYIAILFLGIAFVVLTVVAFFAILFTGKYPKGIFYFNVGVLRWTWRVGFYTIDAFGTDKYPPFSLNADDYPASFEVEYPERLSRRLIFVKWLLAIPHYVVGSILDGGFGVTFGLKPVLVFFAAITLLFTGRYPVSLFDLVMGFNRWAFRVVAYVSLMRDEYQPFRLDQ